MDERGGVVGKQRDLGDRLPPHHRAGEILRQLMLLGEHPGIGKDIDHGHAAKPFSLDARPHRTAV